MRRRPLILAAGALAFSVAAEVFLGGKGHAEFWWSHIAGFFSLYGFVGCLATIWIAKFLGALWLERRETYYDSKDQNA